MSEVGQKNELAARIAQIMRIHQQGRGRIPQDLTLIRSLMGPMSESEKEVQDAIDQLVGEGVILKLPAKKGKREVDTFVLPE